MGKLGTSATDEGRKVSEETAPQRDLVRNLNQLGIPPTAYNIQDILPKGKIDQTKVEDILRKKSDVPEQNIDYVASLLVGVYNNPKNEEISQNLSDYLTRKSVEEYMQRPVILAASPMVKSTVHAMLVDLEKKEQAAEKRNDQETADNLEQMKVLAVELAPFLDSAQRYGLSPDFVQREFGVMTDKVESSRASRHEYAKEDTSESEIAERHLTQSQVLLASVANGFLTSISLVLKKRGVEEEQIAPMVNEGREGVSQTLQADALRRTGKVENYDQFCLAEDKEQRDQIMNDSGFTPNTIRYFDGYETASLGGALAAAGLALLASEITGAPGPQATAPAEAGAAQTVQAQLDLATLQINKDKEDMQEQEKKEEERAKESREKKEESKTEEKEKMELEDYFEKIQMPETEGKKDSTIKGEETSAELIEQNTDNLNEIADNNAEKKGLDLKERAEELGIPENQRWTLDPELAEEFKKKLGEEFGENLSCVFFPLALAPLEIMDEKSDNATPEKYLVALSRGEAEDLETLGAIMGKSEVVALAYMDAVADAMGDMVRERMPEIE